MRMCGGCVYEFDNLIQTTPAKDNHENQITIVWSIVYMGTSRRVKVGCLPK